jgi:hypothetical protein
MINIQERPVRSPQPANAALLALVLVCLVTTGLVTGCARAATPVAAGTGTVAADAPPIILPAPGNDTAGAAGDMRVFEDAQTLAAASDAVVEGSVGEILAREPDDPVQGDKSLLVRVLPVTVLRVLAGDLRPGAVIHVITDDKSSGGVPKEFSPLDPGQHVVLFLEYLPHGTPGISSVPSFYVPRSGDYGTFDVTGSRATSRAAGFLGLRRGQPLATIPGRLSSSVPDLSAAVQAAEPEESRR